MKDFMKRIGNAYFDVEMRLTVDQLDKIVQQELLAQLQSPKGIPDDVLDAMVKVLAWYIPESTTTLSDEDYRSYVQ